MRVHNFAFCNLAKIAMPEPVGTLGTVHRAPRARRARTRGLPEVLGSLRAPGAAAARPCPDPQLPVRGGWVVVLGVWSTVERTGGELRARARLPVDHQASSCAPGARPPPQVAGATDREGVCYGRA
jgi:hypothetical protein